MVAGVAVGQEVLAPVSGLAVTAALEATIEAGEKARSAAHAAQLAQLLELHAVNSAAGFAMTTPAQLALVLSCSEWRAADLLLQAQTLASLPDGLAAVQDGRLTVEQTATAARKLAEVPIVVRVQVWRALLEQLAADLLRGIIRPPRRLAELIDRLILAAAPEEAVQRRRKGERDADVRIPALMSQAPIVAAGAAVVVVVHLREGRVSEQQRDPVLRIIARRWSRIGPAQLRRDEH